MKPWRRSAGALGVIVFALVAGYLAITLIQNVQFARAQQAVKDARAAIGKIEDIATAFRTIGRAVEPSVVSINVRKAAKAPGRRLPFDEDMLRRFFPDRDGDGEPDVPEGFREDGSFEQIGTGSGVIMEATDGKAYILTNNHVAGGAEEMEITLQDGRKITNGKLLGADAKTDLAVIRIETDKVIPAKWGNSEELQKGDWILAFGSPFGYVGSMTHGIVSALNRQAGLLGAQGYEEFIQVDAPINPGNSGGPLVNLKGEVVGINTAIASRSGGFQGVGFAVPSNLAKFVYGQLKDKGKVIRGWLGVSISDVSRDRATAESFGYKGETGVLVQESLPNTPAAGKLQAGDIITSLNGKPTTTVQELRNAIAALPPNSEVKLEVFREGKTAPVTVKLGEQPENLTLAGRGGPRRGPGETTAADALGLRVSDITPQLTQRFQLGDIKSGAVIVSVEPRSLAAREGLRPGDVITQVAGKPVKDASEFAEATKGADVKTGIRLYVSSREGSRFVFLKARD